MERINLETDVLIIGGGSAGLWAANRLKDLHPEKDVLIIDKGPKDWGGLMSMAGGDYEAVQPDESVEDWLKDLIYYFDGLCDQPLMEEILSNSYDRMSDYQENGFEFFKKDDGTLKSVPQRGLPHVKLYPAQLKGRGGEMMSRCLIKQLQEKKVTRMGRILMTDYLKQDGRVVGAVGFDTITGDFIVVKAQATIAATGLGGWKTSYGKNTPTGESSLMAYNAGARLKDFEFARVWNMPKYFGWEGQTTLMPLGARFVNSLGEPFMDKYSPVLHANTDPHFTTIAMAMEIREGRGPIYFDLSKVNPEDAILLKPQTGWQLMNYEKLSALGMDLFRDSTQWVPQMTVCYGGMEATVNGETNVPGLFAAGTARSMEPGVYAGGFALMTTSVTGYLAGEGVAKFFDETASIDIELDEDEISKMEKAIFAPLGKEGLDPKQVLTAIQEIMFPYKVSIMKTETALQDALHRLKTIQASMIPRMAASDPHYLMKLREVEGIAFISELYLRASLERKETRAGHYREDYPRRNDDYFAWLTIQQGEDKQIAFEWKPVPLDTYKYPIERYYSDNFTFIEHE